mgnify:FL=1
MQDIKHKVEAVLFTTGKFLNVEEIANLSSLSNDLVIQALQQLIQDYNGRDTSLEIIQQGDKYKLNIKKEHMHITTKLLKDTELNKPTQETLALIAYKQPVMQSIIVKMRGNRAYEHIKDLEQLEFIMSEKSGRTRLLKATQKFYDYFDIVNDELKEKFKNIELKNEN